MFDLFRRERVFDYGGQFLELFADQIEVTSQLGSRPLESVRLDGYAWRWGEVDQKRQSFERNAFAYSLHLSQGARGVTMLDQHVEAWPVGRWTSIFEDAVGLRVRGWVRKPSLVQQARKDGRLGLSVGWYPVAQRHSGGVLRISQAYLTEVSLGGSPVLKSAYALAKSA